MSLKSIIFLFLHSRINHVNTMFSEKFCEHLFASSRDTCNKRFCKTIEDKGKCSVCQYLQIILLVHITNKYKLRQTWTWRMLCAIRNESLKIYKKCDELASIHITWKVYKMLTETIIIISFEKSSTKSLVKIDLLKGGVRLWS